MTELQWVQNVLIFLLLLRMHGCICLRCDFHFCVFCKSLKEITSLSTLRMKPNIAIPLLEGVVISRACHNLAKFQHIHAVKTEQLFEQITESYYGVNKNHGLAAWKKQEPFQKVTQLEHWL